MRSMPNSNPDKRQLSSSINPCMQLHNSPLRPVVHGWDFDYSLWYIMEIEEKELDTEWWKSQAILIEN